MELTVRTGNAIGLSGCNMDESDIKAAALTRIRSQSKNRELPTVASEFSLNGTGIRADLAVLDRDCFYGIEIKSAADTLKRLPNQMEGYARYFDKTLLIVAPKHLHGLRKIDLKGAEVWRQEILSEWQLHAAGEKRHIDGHWLLHLLTSEDEKRAAREVSQELKANPDLDLNRAKRGAFVTAFKKRYGPPSSSFWKSVSGRRIKAEDVKQLSRFYAEREMIRANAEQTSAKWASWVVAIQNGTADE